jgi:hypothetical protein
MEVKEICEMAEMHAKKATMNKNLSMKWAAIAWTDLFLNDISNAKYAAIQSLEFSVGTLHESYIRATILT